VFLSTLGAQRASAGSIQRSAERFQPPHAAPPTTSVCCRRPSRHLIRHRPTDLKSAVAVARFHRSAARDHDRSVRACRLSSPSTHPLAEVKISQTLARAERLGHVHEQRVGVLRQTSSHPPQMRCAWLSTFRQRACREVGIFGGRVGGRAKDGPPGAVCHNACRRIMRRLCTP
jgi:hypothetical protein